MVFYNDKGAGHECLFKRLRDTFAHGHYGSPKSNWVKIRHSYKGRNDKGKLIRIFGQLRISTLRKLILFLDTVGAIN